MRAVHQIKATTTKRPAAPGAPRLRPSDRRTHEQRMVRNHERLVTAWLRSLSTR